MRKIFHFGSVLAIVMGGAFSFATPAPGSQLIAIRKQEMKPTNHQCVFRDLSQELTRELDLWLRLSGTQPELCHEEHSTTKLIERAMAALAEPEQLKPTDDDLKELFADHSTPGGMSEQAFIEAARSVLFHWGMPF